MPLPWSKGCCGSRKTLSNNRPTLFLSYLSNGEEYEKRDHENEFKEFKNGGRQVWVGLESAGSIWARPTVVHREISRPGSSHLDPPPWPAHVQGGWPKSPPTAET